MTASRPLDGTEAPAPWKRLTMLIATYGAKAISSIVGYAYFQAKSYN